MFQLKKIIQKTTSVVLSGAMLLSTVPVNAVSGISQGNLSGQFLFDMLQEKSTQGEEENTVYTSDTAEPVIDETVDIPENEPAAISSDDIAEEDAALYTYENDQTTYVCSVGNGEITAKLADPTMLPAGCSLVVEEIDMDSYEYDDLTDLILPELEEHEMSASTILPYDIHFIDEEGNEIAPEEGGVSVTVPISAEMADMGSVKYIAHVHDDESVDMITDFKVKSNRQSVTFTTDSFSVFAPVIVADEIDENGIQTLAVAGTTYWKVDGDVLHLSGTKQTGYSLISEAGLGNTTTYSKYSPWGAKTNITTVVFDDEVIPKKTSYWFRGLVNLTTIENIENLDTSNVTTMKYMFYNCQSLTNFDFSGFQTPAVVDLSYMFCGCSAMEEIDLSTFNTAKVTTMAYMFDFCTALVKIVTPKIGINTIELPCKMIEINTTSPEYTEMPVGSKTIIAPNQVYYKLTTTETGTQLNLRNDPVEGYTLLNQYAAEEEGEMPWTGDALTTVVIDNLISPVNMSSWFARCSNLKAIQNLTNVDTARVTNMLSLFEDCSSLEALDLTKFNTANVTNMGYMFSGCRALTNLDCSSFDTKNVITMERMFNQCTSLKTLNIANFDMSKVPFEKSSDDDIFNVTYEEEFINGCSSLEKIVSPKVSNDIALPAPMIEENTTGPVYTILPSGSKVLGLGYSITYNLNGGEVEGNPTGYSQESLDITLANPVKTGYEFTGWTGSNGTDPQTTVTIKSGSTGNKTYTANWKKATYVITYDLAGGTVSGNPESYDIDTATFTLKNPTRSGYTFIGWTSSNESEPQTTIIIEKGSAGNKQFVANWNEVAYSITYNLDGGHVSSNPTTYSTNSSITLNKPGKNGYTFIGWTGSNGTTPQKEVTIDQGSSGNKIYTANWSKDIYTITYDLAGGSVSGNPSSYTIESNTITLNIPTKSGYSFIGWTGSNGKDTKPVVCIPKGSTRDKHYKANWRDLSLTPGGENDPSATNITSIDSFNIQLVSGATKQGDKYIWNPNSSAANHKFVFRINFATSGLKEVAENIISIKVPITILKIRDGSIGDSFEMSVPRKDLPGTPNPIDETDANSEYAYYIDEDNIVIYNCKTVSSAQNGSFEIAYCTSKKTFEYVDMAKSKDFSADISAGNKTDSSDKIPVYINTSAMIDYTHKNYPGNTPYQSWNSSWGTKPDGADDYYFLSWNITSGLVHEPTTKYDFILKDVIKSATGIKADNSKTDIKNQIKVWYNGSKNSNKAVNCTAETKYDFVITGIPKTLFSKYTTIKITNTVTATVHPVDGVDPDTTATDSEDWAWTTPVFTIPTGHFMIWKWGNENWTGAFGTRSASHKAGAWSYASYDLQRLQEAGKTDSVDHIGTDNKTGDLKYVVEAVGYPFPWTLDGDSKNPLAYGHKNVTYQITDDTLYLVKDDSNLFVSADYDPTNVNLGNNGVLLTDGDYEFSSLDFYITESDAERGTDGYPLIDDFTKGFNYKSHSFTNKDVLTFMVKVNGQWIEAGTYNLGTKKASITDSHIKSISNETVEFNSGVIGYKVLTTNNYYNTYFFLTPHVTLFRTDNVLKITGTDENTMCVILKNADTLDVYQGTEDSTFANHTDTEKIVNINKITGDRIRRTKKTSDIKKSVVSTSNNVKKKLCTVGWSVTANEYIIAGTGNLEPVYQSSGKFYDLLPKGSDYLKGSLYVTDKFGKEISGSNISTDVIYNYKNTGRTLLIISISEGANGYKAFYSTTHSWESMADFGNIELNSVAYETGNDYIADGYPDDPSDTQDIKGKNPALSGDEERTIMTDLDDTTDDEKFIYSDTSQILNEVTSAQAGLMKQVMADGDTNYSYETETTINGKYTYRMRFANTYTAQSKDIILFDSIENYNRKNIDTSGNDSQWYGTLKGINVSQLISMGINPVIYYSTESLNLALDENHDLSNSDIWKEYTDGTDLNTVKTIAIDASKASDGSSFVLEPGKSISAYLYMQAPDKFQGKGLYPETYNNIYAKNTVINANGEETSFYIHQDYTTLKYVVKAPVYLHKESSENENLSISDIEFTLSGTSDYGTDVNLVKTTDKDGNIVFKDVESGTYILQETKTDSDWFINTIKHIVIIDLLGNVTVDEKTNATYSDCIIKNTPRIHTDVQFTKRRYQQNERGFMIQGAVFQISGTSDYGNDILMTVVSNEAGLVEFKDIEMGTYAMKEINNPDKDRYADNIDTYTVKVDKNAIVSVYTNEEDGIPVYTDSQGNINIYNIPLAELKITKESSYDSSPVHGTQFVLKGMSDNGTKVDMLRTSDDSGHIIFNGLEAGKYLLYETKTGSVTRDDKEYSAFILDDTKHIVTVDKFGNAVIEGLTATSGYYHISNVETPSGTVTITKKWSDGIHTEDDLPQLYITADTKQVLEINATIDVSRIKDFIQTNSIQIFEPYSGPQLTKAEVESKEGCIQIDDDTTSKRIYAWYEITSNGQKHAYWWSNAEVCFFPECSAGMFVGCASLTALDLSKFNTSNVTDMSSMFSECFSLTALDLSKFNTSNVTDMSSMFSECFSLTELNLSNFDTSNVTDMNNMFYNCTSLTELNISKFNTKNVTAMASMFEYCSSLTELDLSNFNTLNVTDMRQMFQNCPSLTALDLSKFNTSNVTDMSYMFGNCSLLTELDLRSFDTSNVTDMYFMFLNCSSLSFVVVSRKWETSTANTAGMFSDSPAKIGVDLSYIPSNNSTSENGNETTPSKEISDEEKRMQVYESITSNVIKGTQEEQTAQIQTYMTPDENNNAGYWKQNEDGSWTYTFAVFDDSLTYYGWEDVDEDSEYTPDYTDCLEFKTSGIIINVKENDDTPIGEKGSLQISKTVTGHDNDNTEFDFIVQLENKSNELLTGTTVFGDYIFTDGIAHIKLKSGETAVISDIPEQYSYTITEADTENYSHETPAVMAGQIEKNVTEEVSYVNKYDPKEEIKEYGGFSITKHVSGYYDTEFAFPVTVQFNPIPENVTYSINGISHTETPDETGSVTFNIHKDETATFADIPVDTQYSVIETGGSWKASYTAKINNEIVDTKTADTGTDLQSKVFTISKDESPEIIFNNRITQTSPLHLKKTVNGDDKGAEYKINVSISEIEPDTKITSSIGRYTADTDGNINITVSVKNGTLIDFYDIPVKAEVVLTELKNNTTASYRIIDKDGNITAQKENNKNNIDLLTDTILITSNSNNTVEYINNMEVVTEASLQIIKTSEDGIFYLKGAEYKLLKKGQDEEYTAVQQDDKDVILTSGEDGKSNQVDHLTVGDYRLQEIKAPKGYAMKDVDFSLTEADYGTVKTITARDEIHKILLPNTGSRGRLPLLATSMILLIVGYCTLRKRKEE